MTKRPPTIREWSTAVANLPRKHLIEKIEELRAERNTARAQAGEWRRLSEELSKRLPPPKLDVPPPKLVGLTPEQQMLAQHFSKGAPDGAA